jgi:hypothetical protein
MRISCLQIIESSLPSDATVFSMTEDEPNFILAFIFILFGAVNHVVVELIRRFILSKPPGRRMVSLGESSDLGFGEQVVLGELKYRNVDGSLDKATKSS